MRQIIMIGVVAFAVMLSAVCNSASGQGKITRTNTNAVGTTGVQLIGAKWKIVELNGHPVVKKTAGKEDSYIRFTNDGTVSAYAGCNNMTGSFVVHNGLRIKFSNITFTRMACPDMQTELILNQVLKTADNYLIKGKKMTLGQVGKAPLAVFVADVTK